jgi:hypothetical protein
METTGLEGHTTMASAASRASRTPGPGRAARHPRSGPRTPPRRGGAARSTPEIRPRVRRQLQAGAEGIVGDRHQVDAHSPRAGQLAGDLAQRGPSAEPLGPVAVGGQVLITEAEPGDPAQPFERLHHPPGLAGQPPAGLGIDGIGQRVHHRVQIGSDVQPVQVGVVTGVDDGGDLAGGTTSTMPRRSRAAPTPPASAAIIGTRRRATAGPPPAGRGHGGHRRRLARPHPVVPVGHRRCARLRACPRSDLHLRPGRLSVGFDATPLLGRPTGVGPSAPARCPACPPCPHVGVSAFAVSWRRRRGIQPHWSPRVSRPGSGPCRRGRCTRPGPGSSWPPVEWFIGSHDVVHGTNFVVPPTRRAARVVTVHDLTVVLYPELCEPATLAVPGPHPAGGGRRGVGAHPSRFVADQVVAEFAVDPAGPGGVPRDPRLDPGPEPPGGPPVRLPDGCTRYVLAIGTVEPRKDYRCW